MIKSSPLFGDPFIPDSIHADESGTGSDAALLVSLVNPDHPSWSVIAGALREMRSCGVEMDEAAVRIAVRVGTQRWEAGERHAAPSTGKPTASPGSIVYYVRRAALIKIGTTSRPQRRFTELMPDEILAVEPGAYREERMRHRQFAHLRCASEYFRAAPELIEHADRLRVAHGAPDPSWPTTATALPGAMPSALERPPLAAPAAAEVTVTGPDMLLTRQEAAEVARVSVERIRTWERRGHLERAGLNDDGQPVYTALDVAKAQNKLHGFTRVAA